MQIADDSVLPNIIQFNVTVAAAATPVYDVVLTTGSTVFTDVHVISTDHNYTLTDNSLLTWTHAVLSKLDPHCKLLCFICLLIMSVTLF